MKRQNFVNSLVSFCIYIFLFPLFFGGYILRKYDSFKGKYKENNN